MHDNQSYDRLLMVGGSVVANSMQKRKIYSTWTLNKEFMNIGKAQHFELGSLEMHHIFSRMLIIDLLDLYFDVKLVIFGHY